VTIRAPKEPVMYLRNRSCNHTGAGGGGPGWDGRLMACLGDSLAGPASPADRAHGRRDGQPQRDGHDHRRDILEGPDADVGCDTACEEHQQPGADEEKRPGRHDAKVITHTTFLLAVRARTGAANAARWNGGVKPRS